MPTKPKDGESFKGMYPLKGIPPELWARFDALCKLEDPPVSKRYVILALIKKYCDAKQPQTEAAPKPKPERKARTAKPKTQVTDPTTETPVVSPSTPASVPDLGSSF